MLTLSGRQQVPLRSAPLDTEDADPGEQLRPWPLRRLTRHCLEVYGTPQPGGGQEEPGGGMWRLDEAAVCRHFARKLLSGQAEWTEPEFFEAWQASLPEVRRGAAYTAGQATPSDSLPVEGAWCGRLEQYRALRTAV